MDLSSSKPSSCVGASSVSIFIVGVGWEANTGPHVSELIVAHLPIERGEPADRSGGSVRALYRSIRESPNRQAPPSQRQNSDSGSRRTAEERNAQIRICFGHLLQHKQPGAFHTPR